jgi:hypothetical protein
MQPRRCWWQLSMQHKTALLRQEEKSNRPPSQPLVPRSSVTVELGLQMAPGDFVEILARAR